MYFLFTEIVVIRHHRTHIVRTISHDLDHFSGNFVEKCFVARDVSRNIKSMHAVGNTEKASQLLDAVIDNLEISKDKQKRFYEFISIFSVEPAYRELADTMKRMHHSGKIFWFVCV